MSALTHGHVRGGRPTRTYVVWKSAKARCFNQKHKDYASYGGRGITMCDRWRDSFEAFLADMDEAPSDLTLERLDTGGNYELGNCCWATQKEQQRNRRNNRLIEYKNMLVPVCEAAELAGINRNTLFTRLHRGWSVAEALSGVRI